jgi:putative tryptophan/tyrosine transport system substrate-binding protein
VSSLNRPGGNLTDIAALNTAAVSKRLELLHQLVPAANTIALLTNLENPFGEFEASELREAAHALGLILRTVNATSETEIDAAFADMSRERMAALVVSPDPFWMSRRDQVAKLAIRCAMADRREFPTAGGVISYGTNQAEVSRQIGIYVGRILRGAKPAELPVQQVVRVELVMNLKTAKTLGLEVPDKMLALADEVIE